LMLVFPNIKSFKSPQIGIQNGIPMSIPLLQRS
jgi:hypothetical protein